MHKENQAIETAIEEAKMLDLAEKDFKIAIINMIKGQAQWLIPVIPATREAEIRRITVQGQPRQKVSNIVMSTNNLGTVACICNTSYTEA
jgi:hypothetical protein